MTAYADDFDRADTTKLAQPWAQDVLTGVSGFDPLTIVSSTIRPTAVANASSQAYRAMPYSSADQFVQIGLQAFTGAVLIAAQPSIRQQHDLTDTCYYAQALKNSGGATTNILLHINGAESVLATESATTWAANDTLYLEVKGSSFTLKRNGSTLLTGTDTTLLIGVAGMTIYTDSGSLANNAGQNFRCGTFALGVPEFDDSKFPHPILRAPLQQGRLK